MQLYFRYNSGRISPGVGELVEPACAGEDEHTDLGVAEDGQLPSLLKQSGPPLREGHLPVRLVLDPLDNCLSPNHGDTHVLD